MPDQHIRMGRVPIDVVRPQRCEAAPPKLNSRAHTDDGCYRVEKTNPLTGEVWRRHFCTGAAAAFAARHHLPFPPGLWARLEVRHG